MLKVVGSMAKEVLQPIDVNCYDGSPARKRARYDDSSSTNSKDTSEEKGPGGRWSLNKNQVVLHEVFDRGVGRLDCDTEDLFTDDDSIFCHDDPGTIDLSCASMTPESRDKQLILLEATLPKESLEKLVNQEVAGPKTLLKKSDKTNYFDLISDEVLLNILRWLPKQNLLDLSQVCRRFNRVTQDESLWTRFDGANRCLAPGELGKVLSRQVIVLRLAKSEIQYPPILSDSKAFSLDFRCRLLYLDLSMASISTESLSILFEKCRRLKKLSLENVPVNDEVLMALSGNRDIEVINFAMVLGIRDEGLKCLLTNCRKIRELNIAWTYLKPSSIQYICENLPSTMDRLNFSGCRKLLTDKHVSDLVTSCPRLRELDLSDCTVLTGESIRQITLLEDLNFIALSRCYFIPYKSLLTLRKLTSLIYLDIHGGYINDDELKVVQNGLGSKVQINKFMFSSVARPTVGSRRSSVWNIRIRD